MKIEVNDKMASAASRGYILTISGKNFIISSVCLNVITYREMSLWERVKWNWVLWKKWWSM